MTTAVYILRKIALVLSAALTIVVIAALLWMLVFLNKAVAPVRLAVNAAQASPHFETQWDNRCRRAHLSAAR